MVTADVQFILLRRGNRIPYETVGISASDKSQFDQLVLDNKNRLESNFGVSVSYKVKNYTEEKKDPPVEDTPQVEEDSIEEFFAEKEYNKSTDIEYAKDAIEFINNNDVPESFIEGEERVTVTRAFNNKQNTDEEL